MNSVINGRDYGRFIDALSSFGLEISEQQLEQFDLYYVLLVEKNKVMNLTAITEFDDVLLKHFLDSVSLYHLCQGGMLSSKKWNQSSVVDLGTGAGFPGIPLKIMFPKLKVTLMDSLNKRILFLQDVIGFLHIQVLELFLF